MILESVKAASDIYLPISGEISAVNSALEDTPELINDDAFGDGWLFKFVPDNKDDLSGLLSAEDYERSLDQ
jgi:glycine cleavage system H protein